MVNGDWISGIFSSLARLAALLDGADKWWVIIYLVYLLFKNLLF